MKYRQQASLHDCQQSSLKACHPSSSISCLHECMKSCYRLKVIIAITNLKGGVGKSTIAVHLAAWLHERGHRVTLADCDMQQSSSEWIREAVPEIKTVRLDNPDVILNELPTLDQETDFVVADGPGSLNETSRSLLLRADL